RNASVAPATTAKPGVYRSTTAPPDPRMASTSDTAVLFTPPGRRPFEEPVIAEASAVAPALPAPVTRGLNEARSSTVDAPNTGGPKYHPALDHTVMLGLDPKRRKDSTLPIRRHRKLFDREHWIRSSAQTVGESMITIGLIFLLFAAYEVWGKAIIVSQHQHDLDSQLTQEWNDPNDNPVVAPTSGASAAALPAPPGGSIARVYIPR